jgi:hypothetical protein
MKFHDRQDANFFPTELPLWPLRLTFVAVFAAILFMLRHPYLESREVPGLLVQMMGPFDMIVEFAGEVAYYSMLLPIWVKLPVIAVVFGELAALQTRFLLQDFWDTPFLTLGRDGISGRTRWGQQTAKWSDVTAMTQLTTRGLFRDTEQLVISTRLLAEPGGPRAWLRFGDDGAVPVAFVTPASEGAQIPAIATEIFRRLPQIDVRAEEIDGRPAWLRD